MMARDMNPVIRAVRRIFRAIDGFCAFIVITVTLLIWNDPEDDYS